MSNHRQGAVNQLAIKADASGSYLEGYASVFGNVDNGGDRVEPGAFRRSLLERPAAQVKMLLGHDITEPVGVWQDAREDGRGLFVKGTILPTRKGNDVRTLVKAGALEGLSIGYKTINHRFEGNVRVLQQVDLGEVSIVTFSMNEEARITLVKTAQQMAVKLGIPASEVKTLVAAARGDPCALANIEDELEQLARTFRTAAWTIRS